MQERQVFEYAVIRLVPKVEREEFLNLGVILYCGKYKFLEMLTYVNEKRWKIFTDEIDPEEIKQYLSAFDKICKGDQLEGGPIGALPIPDRFRWLTATRSTILQTSKVHIGLCKNPQETLEKLFQQLVL